MFVLNILYRDKSMIAPSGVCNINIVAKVSICFMHHIEFGCMWYISLLVLYNILEYIVLKQKSLPFEQWPWIAWPSCFT